MHLKHLILKQQKRQLRNNFTEREIVQSYLLKIWSFDDVVLRKEIMFTASNDVSAIQKASAATPDGCRSTYEPTTEGHEEENKQEAAKTN